MSELEKQLKDSRTRLKEYKRMLNDEELYRLAILRSIATEQLNVANLKKKLKEQK